MKPATRSFLTGVSLCGVAMLALTGCRTQYVRTRTVYVPAPPPPVVHVAPAPVVEPPPPIVVTPPATVAPVVIIQSPEDFYEPLSPYGRWVVIGDYGRCWVPAQVEIGWRPYANGHWQRTDAGWYWVSDEPWAWATYHYGRWDFHSAHGWIWVPQTQWAPAWVTWREGGGYIGWAPLRPGVSVSVNIKAVECEPAFASRAFVFVEQRRMLEPVRHKTVIVNNTTVINQTVNINTVKVVNKNVINEGPRPDVVERLSGRKVTSVPAHEIRGKEEAVVATRKRTLPLAAEQKTSSPVRTETKVESKPTTSPAPAKPTVVPPATKPAVTTKPSAPEKPAPVTTPRTPSQNPTPVVTPAPVRPTPVQIEPARPVVRENPAEKKVEPEIRKPVVAPAPTRTPTPASQPAPAPQNRTVPAATPRPAPRQLEKSEKTAPVKTTVPVSTPAPAREEKKRDATPQSRTPAPARANTPQPQTTVTFAPPATRPPAKVDTVVSDKKNMPEQKPVEKKPLPARPASRIVEPAANPR